MKDVSTAVAEAKELLEEAKLCGKQFQNAEALGSALEEALCLPGKEWYDE